MGSFSELIKNFEKTRDYVREFFIYGFKVRSDFGQKSLRTYDDEKRRVESWLSGCVSCDDSQRGRQTAITVDSGHIAENPLYQAYRSKSFTDNDILLHFLLLDILRDGRCLTLREICDILSLEYGELFDEQTVRLKLKEYSGEDIVIAEKRGKTAYYRLTPDEVPAFLDEFSGLGDAVCFFSELSPLGVAGNTIMRDADLSNSCFFMKHNYIVHTLEDILLPEIIRAMREQRWLSFSAVSSRTGAVSEKTALPMEILSSLQTGRRYLACYDRDKSRFIAFRLDYIRKAKCAGQCTDYDRLSAEYRELSPRCFGVSFSSPENAQPIKFTIVYDERSESFIPDRIRREMRCGAFEMQGEGVCTVTFDVIDPNEVMQWAKTFIGRIAKIEGGTEGIRQRFSDDIKRMLTMYGGEDE